MAGPGPGRRGELLVTISISDIDVFIGIDVG